MNATEGLRLAHPKLNAAEFWALVNRDGAAPTDYPEMGPCWVWRGDRRPDGRPVFRVGNQRRVPDRVAWQLTCNDPLPPGQWAPACRRIDCVRPDHRGAGGSGWRSSLRHCVAGHPLLRVEELNVVPPPDAAAAANTYVRPDGKRSCRACNRRRVRDIQRVKRAAAREARLLAALSA